MTANEDKRYTFEAALDKGIVHVQFWSWWPGVQVPESMLTAERSVLKYSRKFLHKPKVSDTGIQCALSFKGRSRQTVVPWEAVEAIQQGDNQWGWKVEEAGQAPMAFA